MNNSFEQWWIAEGSGLAPHRDEDHAEHAKRVAEVAWLLSQSTNPPIHTDYCLSFSDLRNLMCGDDVELSRHHTVTVPAHVLGEFLQAKPDRMLGQELLDAFRKLRFLIGDHIDDSEKLLNEIDCGTIGIEDLLRLQTIVDRLCTLSGAMDVKPKTSISSRRKAT